MQGGGRGLGRGRSNGGRIGMGPGGDCLCPNCKYREPHKLSEPCFSRKCPQCGTPMTRT
jgi:hypothetical protein